MALRGSYWLPEGYCRGDWALIKGDLGDYIRHVMDHMQGRGMAGFTSHSRRLISLTHVLKHWIMPARSTRKVRRHYDIDTRIYEVHPRS